MAAETPLKRQRAETHAEDVDEANKRHKSYSQILSLLDQEEDEPSHDLSSLITTLQEELDPLSFPEPETDTSSFITNNVEDYPSSSSSSTLKEEEEDEKDRVIRHLLEASDDELGIPNRVDDGNESFVISDGNDLLNGEDGLSVCDGLWEIEDANANYYAVLQSELFM